VQNRGVSDRRRPTIRHRELGLPEHPPRDLSAAHTLTEDDGALLILSYPLDDLPAPPELTRAETEVVRAALRGRSNAEIAQTRGSAERTVANLLARAFRKLGIHSRAELAARLGRR
jgi:DNA-binding NarL/FixJ family response regulator